MVANLLTTANIRRLMNRLGVSEADMTALQGDVVAHTGNITNPHAVTKAQVGLGNADNTSDANKPVSLATTLELAIKADASHFKADIITAHQSTTLATQVAIAQMSFAIGANEKWVADFFLNVGSGGTNGERLSLSIPTGGSFPIRALATGDGATSNSTLRGQTYLADTFFSEAGDGVSIVNFHPRNATDGVIVVHMSIVGTDAGTVQLNYASAVAGETSTVFSGSYFEARRVS